MEKLGTATNGTKLRGIVAKRAACLPTKSAKFPIKRHLAQPLRRSNMLNLVPLYGGPEIQIIGSSLLSYSNICARITRELAMYKM